MTWREAVFLIVAVAAVATAMNAATRIAQSDRPALARGVIR